MSKNLSLRIEQQDEFVKDLIGKNHQELKEIIRVGMQTMVMGTYDLLRACYMIEIGGSFKEDGYGDFESWLEKETFLSSYSLYRSYVKIAKRYSRMTVEKIGFQKLAAIESIPLTENTRETVVSKIEHDIETKDLNLSRKQIVSMVRPLAVRKESQAEASLIEVLRTKLREAKKKISELTGRIRDLEERLMKAEIKNEDQARYIKELQSGERVV